VVLSQHIQHHITSGVDGVENGIVAVDTDQHRGWVHADLANGGGGHRIGAALMTGGDYNNRAHQIAQGVFQIVGNDSRIGAGHSVYPP